MAEPDLDPFRRRAAGLETEIEQLRHRIARQSAALEAAGLAEAAPRQETSPAGVRDGGSPVVSSSGQAPGSEGPEPWRFIFERLQEGSFIGEVVRDARGVARDWRFVTMNPAWERLSGLSRDACAGRTVSEVIPGIEPEWITDYVRVVETGATTSFTRKVGPLGFTYQVRAFRIEDDRFAVLFFEVSGRKRAELRRSALLELADRLRDTRDPADVSFAAGEILGRTLGTSRGGYGTIDPDRELFSVERDWSAPGIATLAGSLRFRDFGSYVEDLKRGETVVIADAALDPRTAATASDLAALSARSFVNLPVLEAGGFVALAYVTHAEPRSWTDEDLSFIRDVAERTRSAVERRRAEDGLRQLAASLERQVADRTVERDGVWRVSRDMLGMADRDSVWRSVNPAWTRILGWNAEDFVGRTSTWMLHPDDREGAQARRDALAAGQTVVFEGRYRTRAGDYRLLSWTAVPSEGRIYSVARDVTEERAREAALRDSRDFARLALTSVGGIGVWTYDLSQNLFRCDPAIADLYGIDPGRAVAGLPSEGFLANVHPDDRSRLAATMASGLEQEGDLELEYRIVHPGGEVRWVMSRGHTYFGDDGRPARRTGVGIETTKQREMAEQLRQSQKMEAVGQLTGGLAHDFNNLLTGISGSLDLLQKRVVQGRLNDLDRYLIAAQGAAKRAAALTHRLLAFSRRQTLDPKPTDVHRLVLGMTDLIRRTVGPEISVETVDMVGLWQAMVDPPQLENALLNLCINARDAMPDGGRITIETANRWMDDRTARERDVAPGQYLSLCVSDTGTGMSPDVIARAFDPFFTTKPLGQGTGLGLSMIYGFARQSGGQVRIYSEVGQGTMVCIYLPRHRGEAGDPGQEADRHGDVPRAIEGETVLIVDDEPTVRMLVADVLGDLGYSALEAEDGASGLSILQSRARIDLLITDVGLPNGMNGRQVADAARVIRPGLKVLFITGYAENAVIGNGQLDPGMAVLTKPFAMDDLAGKIRGLIAP